MTIQYDNLLALLRGVRKTHPRPGIARSHRALCPCHQADGPATWRSPSLSLAESESGVILIKCHSGCSASEVAAAAGLDLADLFPSRGGGDGGERGNGGPEAWVSAAACASAVSQLADEFLRERNVDVFLSLNRAIQIFKKVARAVMRESRGGATK